MKIKQLYCNFSNHFKIAIANKFNLDLVYGPSVSKALKVPMKVNANEPVFIFGCYNDMTLRDALSHQSTVVICWAGTDAKTLVDTSRGMRMDATPARKLFSWAEILRGFPNIKHIAMSKFIADDLKECGLPYVRVPVFVHDLNSYKPCPPGDSIYMYQPNSLVYNGKGIYYILRDRLPFNFIETTSHTFDRDKLMDAYRQSFMGLRFTEHDGMNHTGCELGLMGRRQIYNGDLPCAIHYDKTNVNDIIGLINNEYEYAVNNWQRVAEETRSYLDVGEDFLNTEYYE